MEFVQDFVVPSILARANGKARGFLKRFVSSGNVNQPLDSKIEVGDHTAFGRYINTFYALQEHIENGKINGSKISSKGFDPQDYKVMPKIQQVLVASRIMLSNSSSMIEEPIFKAELPQFTSDFEFMSPAVFNDFQDQVTNMGDKNIFAAAKPFNVDKVVTLEDLQVVFDKEKNGYLYHVGGTIEPEVSFILNVQSPIPSIEKYLPNFREMNEKDVIVWLAQEPASGTSTAK